MLAKKGLMTAPAAVAQYVEDVFSTYLYTGNGSTQTITNNIDLSGEGGLVWLKKRSDVGYNWQYDTARGAQYYLSSNATDASTNLTTGLTAFTSTGFTLGNQANHNGSGETYASWAFRKAEKFFDVVKYTGNATAGRTISHNLGSTPGCIFVKRLGSAENWAVWHRGLSAGYWMQLNTTDGQTNAASADIFGNGSTYVDPTSTVFTVGSENRVNDTGSDYVAYLFAHDAGGFGEAGDQSVIKCGSFTHNGTSTAVDLGWEPQWLILKRRDTTGYWELYDNMRGFGVGSSLTYLYPNASFAETSNARGGVTATGVTWDSGLSSGDYIYIAIRRGPMKTPEAGTEVFKPVAYDGNGTTNSLTAGFPPDLLINSARASSTQYSHSLFDRMRGNTVSFRTANDYADLTGRNGATGLFTTSSTGIVFSGSDDEYNKNGSTQIAHLFRRAPGFFDVVSYTGTGSSTTVSHNLGVAPELMLVKRRNSTGNWAVYSSARGATKYLLLNVNSQEASASTLWNDTTATSSVFTVGTSAAVNSSGGTYMAYLFSSLSGVSSIGTYTGNGSSVTVTTGFQPRFILVKRVDSTGDWIVSDSARGLIAGNDPYILLNSDVAEDTDEDWADVSSTGFTVNEISASSANTNGGTYLYLAIA